jgi:hypothetical protein
VEIQVQNLVEEFTGCIVSPENLGQIRMFDIDDIWGALCGEGSLTFDLCYRCEELLDGLEWSNRPSDDCIIRLLGSAVDSYAQAIGQRDIVLDTIIYNPSGNTSVLEYQHKCLSILASELFDNINKVDCCLNNWRSVEIEGESSDGPIVWYFKI